MADYISAYSGSQIDGSVASSSLYFSGAGSTAHISASGNISGSGFYSSGESNFISNITGSGMHISMSNGTISASSIYTDPASFHIGSAHITSDKWDRVEKGRKPRALTISTFTDGDTTPSVSGG